MNKTLGYIAGLGVGMYMAVSPLEIKAQDQPKNDQFIIAKVAVKNETRNENTSSYSMIGMIIEPDLRKEGFKIFHKSSPYFPSNREYYYLDLYISPKDTIDVEINKFDLHNDRIRLDFEDLKRVNGEKINVPEIFKSKW
ncbi:MAG: hypothetical protein KJ583_04590 [Nanoarchaeota archaeon]|nr:hypothetical protein [Nanoarchaeota archaeon]MBU1270059.1 hypothetical protein [Nanoarchaeota archaeon]MBU1604570.1 hypothetical protein [Nanoarchaeota archaeon]MBU2443795.1 hypothetical protein [Nanoarchaeota archaeon]